YLNVILSPRYCFLLNDPTPSDIYTLSLHDALPILDAAQLHVCHVRSPPTLGPAARSRCVCGSHTLFRDVRRGRLRGALRRLRGRSEEHTSELQSRENLVCRLLLEKKKIL